MSIEINRGVVALHFVLFLVLAVAAWALPSGRFVLVLTNPGTGAGGGMSVIEAAGGAFVSAGRLPWMSIAYSEQEDFAGRLMRSGALLVLNHKLAVGCLKE